MSSVGSRHRDPRPASRACVPGHQGGPQRVQQACVEGGDAGPTMSSRPVSPGSACARRRALRVCVWRAPVSPGGEGRGGGVEQTVTDGRDRAGGSRCHGAGGGTGCIPCLALRSPLGRGRVHWASVLSAVLGDALPESNPAPGGRLCGISALTAVHTHHPPPPPRLCSRDAAAPRASPEGSDFPLVTSWLAWGPGAAPGPQGPGSSLTPGDGAT